MVKCIILPKTQKMFLQLDPPIQKRILQKMKDIGDRVVEGKFLHGDLKGFQSIRAGKYRLLYRWDGTEIVLFHRIGHRQDVYE